MDEPSAGTTAFVLVRVVLDGVPVPGGADHYQPYSTADSNATLHAMGVNDVAVGTHTLKLQWATTGDAAIAWRSCTWADTLGPIAARALVPQAFYK